MDILERLWDEESSEGEAQALLEVVAGDADEAGEWLLAFLSQEWEGIKDQHIVSNLLQIKDI
jgi:hypothetical protein